MTKIERLALVLIRTFLIFFGLYITLGWLLLNPDMVKIIPDSTAVVLNTAFCFIISGIWLTLRSAIAPATAGTTDRWASSALALVLIVLPALVLAESIGNLDLGIDNFTLHKHIADRNPTPGRMASNTCAAFILTGIAFFVSQSGSGRVQKRMMTLLGGLILLIGLSSLLSYAMNLNWLYYFFSYNRMAIPTSAALMALGTGILLISQNAAPESRADGKQDVRITRLAAIVMILLALTSGLTGFIVLKQGADQFLQDELLQKAKNGVESITANLERQILLKNELLSFPVFEKDLETLPGHPDDAAARDHLDKVALILSDLSFSGMQLRNAAGATVYAEGALLADPGVSFPIQIQGQNLVLMWHDGFLLHSEKPILKDGAVIGTFVTEQKLTGLDRLFRQLREAGKTTDAALCQRSGDVFDCFPSRFVSEKKNVDMFADGAPSYPMAHALLGEIGTIYANDIRGIPVLAAFAPVGDTGLGFVVKIETVEFYSFIRKRLHIFLGALALLVAGGVSIMRFQLQPLASRLVQSEQRMRRAVGEKTAALDELEKTADFLRLSEARTRVIIESAYDAFIALDEDGYITDWNAQAEKIFGWGREQVIGKSPTGLIVAPASRAAFAARLAQIRSPDYRAEENQRLEINVVRASGGEFVVEMVMSPIRSSDGVTVSAFLHDVTERRQHHEKLTQLAQYDALTGLPNRSLFMDRLAIALLRADRAQQATALMFLDLDGFKRINDTFGHQAGDEALKIFAHRLTVIRRKADTVARLAGDEFTVILENISDPERDAQAIAAKILDSMRQPFEIAGEKIILTTSIGIMIAASGATNSDELIKRADAEMYKAKNKGKNQFSVGML